MQPHSGAWPRSSELAPDLRMFERWTAVLFGLSVTYHLLRSFVFKTGGHAAYPLARGRDRFYDFTIFTEKFQYFHTSTFWHFGFPINYPAPCIVFYELFFRFLKPHELFAFELFCVLAFVVPAVLFARALVRRGVSLSHAGRFMLVTTLFSWPAVLLVDGGNVEVVVWVALAIGMWAYATGRLWIAAAFFGIGASMKLFPFVLLGLFLSRKQYSKILFGVFVFFAVSLITMAIVGPSIAEAYRGIAFGLASFKVNYMGMWHPGENGVDHSLFALFKLFEVRFFHHSVGGFRRSLSAYLDLMAVSGLLLYWFRIRLMPLLNQVLVLVIASIYLTAFSGDGTLIHLYYPCTMLFLLAQRAWASRVVVPGLKLILGCLVFILSFETFLVRHEQRYIGPAHCIGLGILLFAALKYPLGPSLARTTSERVLTEPDMAWLEQPEPAAAGR